MDSVINELYYGNICPVEQMGRLTPEARTILKRIHENVERLEESLNEQEKAILHSIQDDRLELAASVGEKRFLEAFTLGASLRQRYSRWSWAISIRTTWNRAVVIESSRCREQRFFEASLILDSCGCGLWWTAPP